MIIIEGIVADTRSGISVYMRITADGKRQNNSVIAIMMAYESFNMRFTTDITFSGCPSPMILLTSVLHVDANAERIIQSSPDTPRTMLDIAKERSPRCSM